MEVAIASTAAVTIVIMASISVAIHFIVYHCVYKPRVRSQAGNNKDVAGDVEAVMYESVNELERVGPGYYDN